MKEAAVDAKSFDCNIWDAGLTIEQYVDQMSVLQQAMRRRIAWIRLTPFERKVFSSLQAPLKVMVVTVDESLDSLMNMPVLAQMSYHAPQMDVRVYPRELFPDLARQFEERGLSGLPVFAFFDETCTEVAVWNGRPVEAQHMLERWEADGHPSQTLREEMEDWYDQGLQCETTDEIRALLSPYLDT